MTEREYSLKLQAGLEDQGFLPYGFHDQAKGVEKPFDFCVCCPGGTFWAVESKRIEVPSWGSVAIALQPKSFRPRQMSELIKVAGKRGRSSVALFVECEKPKGVRAWLLSAKAIASRFRNDEVLRVSEVIQTAEDYELVRIPKIGWGLSPRLLNHIQSMATLSVVSTD